MKRVASGPGHVLGFLCAVVLEVENAARSAKGDVDGQSGQNVMHYPLRSTQVERFASKSSLRTLPRSGIVQA